MNIISKYEIFISHSGGTFLQAFINGIFFCKKFCALTEAKTRGLRQITRVAAEIEQNPGPG